MLDLSVDCNQSSFRATYKYENEPWGAIGKKDVLTPYLARIILSDSLLSSITKVKK